MKGDGAFIKVDVTLIDGVAVTKKMPRALVWLQPNQRLQDLINDGRLFIPIYKVSQMDAEKLEFKLVNKSVIAMIEEVPD